MSKNTENDKTKTDMTTTQNITFDKEDGLLFSYSDDLLLKAKAIQNSILPKLQVVLQDAVSLIRTIYGVEVFEENSTILKRPNFRPQRKTEMKHDYMNASIGLMGNFLPIWKNMEREDGKPVRLLPIGYNLILYGDAIVCGLDINYYSSCHLNNESLNKLFYVFFNNIEIIQSITNYMNMSIGYPYEKTNLFRPIKIQFSEIYNSDKKTEHSFAIFRTFPLPIMDQEKLDEIKLCFAALFPIYDSLLRVAKGERIRFSNLVQKLSDYMIATFDKQDKDETQDENAEHNGAAHKSISYSTIKANAQKKIDSIGIRTSIRWQVFERDNFRCVACGAGAADGAILHVDHILPRSKGGKDTMSNYQTLCWKCNIGKSNKSDRNLRNG